MALSDTYLSTLLESLTTDTTALEAAEKLAEAYASYMIGAAAGAFPLLATVAPKAAMSGAMVFPTVGTAASAGASIQAGVVAFWAAMVAAPATYFAAATVIAPPAGLTTLGTALSAVFTSNIGSSLELSADAMAAAIHAASAGGTATFPPSTVTPIA